MDKLSAMQAFTRVVEAGTFTKAADSLGLPKAAVTRLIQSLEDQLQTRLLNRTTRRVTVTPDGAAYYERVSRLLGDLDELEGSLSHARVTPKGRIRVDVSSSVARLLLIPALPQFHAQYPEIQIDLGVSDRPVDLVSDNVDCVLRGTWLSGSKRSSVVCTRSVSSCILPLSRFLISWERVSTASTCLATSTSGRAGATYTALENRSRVVTAAIAPISTQLSGHGVSGAQPGSPDGEGYGERNSRGYIRWTAQIMPS